MRGSQAEKWGCTACHGSNQCMRCMRRVVNIAGCAKHDKTGCAHGICGRGGALCESRVLARGSMSTRKISWQPCFFKAADSSVLNCVRSDGASRWRESDPPTGSIPSRGESFGWA
eukprot:362856-Chlamydomonas_euryale.AAC.18